MERIGTTGITSATDSGPSYGGGTGTGVCESCGQPLGGSRSLEQFLARLGISEEMVNNLKTSMNSIDFEEYLNTARDYLTTGKNRATEYAKENPGKVAAGAAALALGAGLLIAALNRDKQ